MEPCWHPEEIHEKVEAAGLTQPVALLLPTNGPNHFVNRSRSILRSCFLQGKTSSYFCRRFSVRKVLTRQAMYIESNIKKCSRNNFHRGREMSSEIVWDFAVLIIQHAKEHASYFIVVYSLHVCSNFLTYKRDDFVK